MFPASSVAFVPSNMKWGSFLCWVLDSAPGCSSSKFQIRCVCNPLPAFEWGGGVSIGAIGSGGSAHKGHTGRIWQASVISGRIHLSFLIPTSCHFNTAAHKPPFYWYCFNSSWSPAFSLVVVGRDFFFLWCLELILWVFPSPSLATPPHTHKHTRTPLHPSFLGVLTPM